MAPAAVVVAPPSFWRRGSSVGLRLLVPIPQGKGFRSKLAWIGRRVVYWYLIILVMLAFFQRYLIYQPTRADAIDPQLSGFEPGRVEAVSVPTADGLQLNGWLVRAFPTSRDA